MKNKKNIIFVFILFLTVCLAYAIAYLLPALLNVNGYISGAIAAVVSVIILILLFLKAAKINNEILKTNEISTVSSVSGDYIRDMDLPCAITDTNGRIVYINRTLASVYDTKDGFYGRNLSELVGENIISSEHNEQLGYKDNKHISLGDGRRYSYRINSVSVEGKDYLFIMFNDDEDFLSLSEKYNINQPVIAYIMIDNSDELQQIAGSAYRLASAKTAEIIKDWVDEHRGVFLEYERDRYIYIFNKDVLDEYESNGFSILDKFRNVRVDNGRLPVTISMGIASSYDFASAEASAKAAIDMALQRGGDQVVVKKNDGMTFYGGRTKTSQKRTTVKSRVFTEELCMSISNSSNVLIMGHTYPDFDSIGSCLGVHKLCNFCGVESRIIINKNDDNLKKIIDILDPDREILTENLFCTPNEAMDMLSSVSLTIVCDTNNILRFMSRDVFNNSYSSIIIDHHRKTAEFDNARVKSYIDPSASSASELVSEILELALEPGDLESIYANLLLSGIVLDTKMFSRNTGSRTFGAAQYLRNEGAMPGDVNDLFRTDLDVLQGEANFESDITVYRSVIAISTAQKEQEVNRVSAARAADRLLTLENIHASFILFESEDTVHISARSDGSVNVQLILEKLGGGGYYDAAATQIKGKKIEDASQRLKEAIDSYLDGVIENKGEQT